MPSTNFWAVTNQGKVFTLSTSDQQWEELRYCGMEFKRVSSSDWCAWAIGGDHQMYVYVFGTDVPIRFKEVAYENHRWNPKEGFCSRLLPTDRPAWSSDDGLTARFREKIKLPTLSWQWEGDWRVEHNFDGEAADPEGWMYAIDFPAVYTKEKSWLSYVRRRKWTRLRRYVSTNTWANVPCIHDDPVLEPFIDVAIGGQDVPGGNRDGLAVWAVTVLGRIMLRTQVHSSCPEGQQWVHVPTPQGCEVNQLAVGPTGLLWAVMWNGKALVRLGVTRTSIMGTDWHEVLPPNDTSKIFQVSVGTNSVWAITRDNKVWFRKGIKGAESGVSVDWATGSGWVEMVGEMIMLTVGLNDQVWALGADERRITYFRTGVTPQELSGKTWRPIILPRLSRAQSHSSSEENVCQSAAVSKTNGVGLRNAGHDLSQSPQESKTLRQETAMQETSSSEGQQQPRSLPTAVNQNKSNGPTYDTDCSSNSPNVSLPREASRWNTASEASSRTSACSAPGTPRMSPRSRVPSISSLHGMSWLSAEDTGYYDDDYLDVSWSWISGSGCAVDGQNPPNWFGPGLFSQQFLSNEPWRKEILDLLSDRHIREAATHATYEQAIDRVSWLTTGKAQVLVEGRHNQWVDCKLELEKTGAKHEPESATFSCFYQENQADWHKIVLNVATMTCIVCVNDRHKPVLAIYTASRTKDHSSIRVAFSSDSELEDWMSLFSTTCCEIRGLKGTPASNAVWSLTNRGDVFIHDPPTDGENLLPCDMFWRQVGGHLRIVECCAAGVVWGIGYNYSAWIYTGGWGGGFFKAMDSSANGTYPMSDLRCMYIYENQRWNPLTGFANRGLPTDRYTWSDKTGTHECTKENTKLPSMHWQWITDWTIDYNTPGGVDKDGWQYAKDFPMTYHGYKGLTDYVRRRRWIRKCKLTTTGPWEELDSVRLIDISLQVDHNGSPNTPIRTWAVSAKGEVLCRIGTTKQCPRGLCWEHVPLEQPAQSVSVGGGQEVWVVTKNGNAFLRHGVTDLAPTGTVWFSVAPPERGCPLRQVSAGPTSVWAVDTSGSVWFRQEIMPIFPEGTCWKHVCGNIRSLSVGPCDQVWGIADTLGNAIGVVCRRIGVTNENKLGSGWEYGIGGSWHHISVRGFCFKSKVI